MRAGQPQHVTYKTYQERTLLDLMADGLAVDMHGYPDSHANPFRYRLHAPRSARKEALQYNLKTAPEKPFSRHRQAG
jgi:hypothetical protein